MTRIPVQIFEFICISTYKYHKLMTQNKKTLHNVGFKTIVSWEKRCFGVTKIPN